MLLRKKSYFKNCVPMVLAAILSTNSAYAAEEKNKIISGESVFEFHLNDQFSSDDNNNEYVDSFGRNETAVTINLTKNLTIESNFVLERLKEESANGENRAFNGEGIFTEELKLRYSQDNFSVFGGKFNPAFGTAWDWGRGIWTHKLAEEYEQTEKLGGGFTATAFNHTLEVSAFHDDVKVLDGSIMNNRSPRPVRGDGVPGNTDNFRSYNISISSENPFGIEGWSYNAAYLNSATDNTSNDNQKGFVVGTNYVFDVNKNINMDALLEYAGFNDYEGVEGAERRFVTANLITTIHKNWNATVGIAKITDEAAATLDTTHNLFQVSAGYKFGEKFLGKKFILPGLSLEAGYKYESEDDGLLASDTETLGVLSRYTLEF